ncbi:MAG: ATP-binding protein, partial [Bacteroidaceae bacterium]|nr:ATP-binding protein [Bacteroidaceae bacterium]
TGIRRCGKTYLLFNLFAKHLANSGVPENHIIKIELDSFKNRHLRAPEALYDFVEKSIVDDQMYYVLLDEIQIVPQFEEVLNGFLHIPNVDVYVTGSNARLLSKDVITEFRGRGDEVHMYPLSFSEFLPNFEGTERQALDAYMLYGGLPQVVFMPTTEQKVAFLKNIFVETYMRDIKERYSILGDDDLEELIDLMASNISSLTNPKKLADTFRSVKQRNIAPETVKTYLDYICDAFLLEKATRYDVKGKKYIDTPHKFYFADMGLRNARLNFRQNEPTHLMENVIYNELRMRGFNVDVGVVKVTKRDSEGKQFRTYLEVDFICNQGSQRYYIQSAYQLGTEEKIAQEEASLRGINDTFKKIIIVGDDILPHRNEVGIVTLSIYDFLKNEKSLEMC